MYEAAVDTGDLPSWYRRAAADALDTDRGRYALDAACAELLRLEDADGDGALSWAELERGLAAAGAERLARGRYWRLAPGHDLKLVLDDFVDEWRRAKPVVILQRTFLD